MNGFVLILASILLILSIHVSWVFFKAIKPFR